jgi:large subunit ribosomal protein L5
MAKSAAIDPKDNGPAVAPRLRDQFKNEIAPKLKDEFGITNPNAWPKLEKIVLNVNMGRHIEGTKVPANIKDQILDTLTKITGQKPVVIKARKSVSNFKVREGYDTAAMVTIRRERMWFFLDRLINLATPRIKDFRGVSANAFDASGNYSMGLTEQGVFPEIDMARVTFTHGMNINFVFSNSSPEISRFVLTELGFPFAKPDQN